MYELKPILQHNLPIQLPNTMYKLKNILGTTHDGNLNGIDGDGGVAQSDGDWKVLQERQATILQQLAELKNKLVAMRKKLGVCAKPAQPSAVSSDSGKQITIKLEVAPIQTKHLQDVVINANPNNVPHSLLTLQKLWKNRLNLVVKCYTHSTIGQLAPSAQQFIQLIESSVNVSASVPTLNVALIWKDVPIIELQCAPTTFIPLYGEANIIRYFSRVGPNEYGYDTLSIVQSAEIDSVLDICHELIVGATNSKDRQALLKKLNVKLGKESYFGGGDRISVADIALYSAVRQLNVTAKDLTPTLNSWLKRIDLIG